jgi:sRNA-binding protein
LVASHEQLGGAAVTNADSYSKLTDSHVKLTNHVIAQEERHNQERAENKIAKHCGDVEAILPPAKEKVAFAPAAAPTKKTKKAPRTRPKEPSKPAPSNHNFTMGDAIKVTATGVTGRVTKPHGTFVDVDLDDGSKGKFHYKSLQKIDH